MEDIVIGNNIISQSTLSRCTQELINNKCFVSKI